MLARKMLICEVPGKGANDNAQWRNELYKSYQRSVLPPKPSVVVDFSDMCDEARNDGVDFGLGGTR
jgi:hypothetical protein